jgi:hypothetical protein
MQRSSTGDQTRRDAVCRENQSTGYGHNEAADGLRRERRQPNALYATFGWSEERTATLYTKSAGRSKLAAGAVGS